MFKKLFGKKKKNKRQEESSRDLFAELFPLSIENKEAIENDILKIFKDMFGEEGAHQLKNYKREYEVKEDTFQSLIIDTLGWELEEQNKFSCLYENKYNDYLKIDIAQPNGVISKESNNLPIYRNWLRGMFVNENGGLISCKHFKNNEIDAFESIGKIPRKEITGIDYTYFLNIRNYEEQKLYQVIIRVNEGSPTGMRDNLLLHPLSEITNLDMEELTKLYRKDPYDDNFKIGNRRNLSEMEEFDYLFPFHPLSIIRQEIRPRILKSIKFK